MFELIAFDADDTLWHNENHYHEARERFRQLMAGYEVKGSVDERADFYEVANIEYYGYGVMSFVLSLIEAALELTGGAFRGEDVQALLDMSKEMLTTDVRVFDGVHDTLTELAPTFPLMLITKGDLLHQQNKVVGSGLHDYFRYVEVVSHKTPEVYAEILQRHKVQPEQFLMVGNSLRSDVLPVAELGAWAVHVPTETTWAHEVVEMPASVNGHVFEVPHITQVPDLLRQLPNRPRT